MRVYFEKRKIDRNFKRKILFKTLFVFGIIGFVILREFKGGNDVIFI